MVAGPGTLIPMGRKMTAARRCAVNLQAAIFKAALLVLASALCKPPEQSLSLALPWFNLGILLSSSLTLTLAGTACTGLKGKKQDLSRAAAAQHSRELLLLPFITLNPGGL